VDTDRPSGRADHCLRATTGGVARKEDGLIPSARRHSWGTERDPRGGRDGRCQGIQIRAEFTSLAGHGSSTHWHGRANSAMGEPQTGQQLFATLLVCGAFDVDARQGGGSLHHGTSSAPVGRRMWLSSRWRTSWRVRSGPCRRMNGRAKKGFVSQLV
jgi:hypothetical protein